MEIKKYPIQLQYLINYFGVDSPHEILWAHRTNTRKDLDNATISPFVMMIEGDIYFLPDTAELIMAHYNWDTEDMSLDFWLTLQSKLPTNKKLYFNEWYESIIKTNKGAKLDFKTPDAILHCLKHIKSFGNTNTPIIFHADVLEGPGGKQPIFNASEFVAFFNKHFPNAILSLGCLTSFKQGAQYEHSLINRLLSHARQYEGCVTFPIRACFVKNSKETLPKLLTNNDYSICIFNLEVLSNEDLANIKKILDVSRTFFDIWNYPDMPNYYD